MAEKEPEQLHEKTPQWFREWREKEFWHFKICVENKLSLHSKLVWTILGALLALIIAKYVVGY